MKKNLGFAVAVGLLAAIIGAWYAPSPRSAHAGAFGPTAWTASSTTISNLPIRQVLVDGAGRPFTYSGAVGWKVFEDSVTASPVVVVDESSTTASVGILHQVCLNPCPGTYVVVYDSNTVSGISAVNAGSLIGQLWSVFSSTNAQPSQTCQVYDAQFQHGMVVQTSNATCAAYLYWQKNSNVGQ